MDDTQANLERTRLLTKLKECRLFQRIAEMSPDFIYVAEFATGRLTYISPRSEQVIGYSADHLQRLGNHIAATLWHPDDMSCLLDHQRQRQALQNDEVYECEYRLRQPDGSYRWLRTRSSVFSRTADGQVQQVVGITQDVTVYKLAEHHRLQARGQLVYVQEAERLSLARELHNSLGQYANALLLNLHAVQGDLPPAVTNSLRQLQTLALQMNDEVDRIAFALRPWVLDELGLAAALHQLVKKWTEVSGVPVDLDIQELNHERLLVSVETTLYRIIQEALTNIHKHASASIVSISVEQRSNEVFTLIVDNGRGFDLVAIQDVGQAPRHLGLISMVERAQLAGGRLDIESSPTAGTTLYVHIPIHLAK